MIDAVPVPSIRRYERCRLFASFHDFAQPGALAAARARPHRSLRDLTACSTTKETSMPQTPQRRDSKKVGKTLKEKREAKRTKQQDKKLIER